MLTKILLKQLKEMRDIQCNDGNWNYSPYMFGLANGLIFAVALLEGVDPVFLERPAKWLSEAEED
jgi:hypothetical protein